MLTIELLHLGQLIGQGLSHGNNHCFSCLIVWLRPFSISTFIQPEGENAFSYAEGSWFAFCFQSSLVIGHLHLRLWALPLLAGWHLFCCQTFHSWLVCKWNFHLKTHYQLFGINCHGSKHNYHSSRCDTLNHPGILVRSIADLSRYFILLVFLWICHFRFWAIPFHYTFNLAFRLCVLLVRMLLELIHYVRSPDKFLKCSDYQYEKCEILLLVLVSPEASFSCAWP